MAMELQISPGQAPGNHAAVRGGTSTLVSLVLFSCGDRLLLLLVRTGSAAGGRQLIAQNHHLSGATHTPTLILKCLCVSRSILAV
jgi:hypothetical protein